jgi:hypothetical protein
LADAEWSRWPDRKIALVAGVSREYVVRVKASCDRSQDTGTRVVARSGIRYLMQTTRIGSTKRIDPAVREIIKDTPLADRPQELVALARLPPERQVAVAEKIVSSNVCRVRDALHLLYQEKKTILPADLPVPTDRYQLLHGDCAAVSRTIAADSIDVIITDPPYAQAYLPLYETLACIAARVLKPGGSLVAMAGNMFLPDILAVMRPYLQYQWVLAYLMPGDNARVYQRRVLSAWKPVLWFTKGEYAGNFIYDVLTSKDSEKTYHRWQQSVSGFTDIVTRFIDADVTL